MFSIGSLPLKKAAKSIDAAGFTLIEITMALILLGILGAVAVPKYFDMQSQAATKKCKYDQSVVLTELYNRYAISKITDAAWDADATISQVLQDLGECANGRPCPKLCPEHQDYGQYTVRSYSDGTDVLFTVSCSVPGHSSGIVTADNADSFLNWIKNNYELALNNTDRKAWELTVIQTFGDYFSYLTDLRDKKIISDEEVRLDSDPALEKYPNLTFDENKQYKSMAALLEASMAKSGIDTSQIVWSLLRGEKKTTNDLGYQCQYTFYVADKPATEGSTDQVTVKAYTIGVIYNSETEAQEKNPSWKEGDLYGIKNIWVNPGSSTATGKSLIYEDGHYKIR